jgi:hypothetical protein
MHFRQTSFTKISQTFLTNQKSHDFHNVFIEAGKFSMPIGGWVDSPTRSANQNKTREYGEKMSVIIRSKNLAIIAIYAALYAALVVVLGFFIWTCSGSCHRFDAQPCLSWYPRSFGHTLGYSSPTFHCYLDLLNTMPSFVMSFLIYYVHKRTQNDYTVIITIALVVIGTTVGWMLSYLYSLPLLPQWVT